MDLKSLQNANPDSVKYMMMSPDEVRQRAERDAASGRTVEMFDWEYRKLDTPVPASVVRETIIRARGHYLNLRKGSVPPPTDEELRQQMFASDASFKAIGDPATGTHPTLFEKVTKPELPQDHLRLILQMIDMRRSQENGMPLEQATAQVTEFFKTRVARVVESDLQKSSTPPE